MAESNGFVLRDDHFHSHVRRRMEQRGVTEEEVRETLDQGWEASDAKAGTKGRTQVFLYDRMWEGTYYDEKEVTVYFKIVEDELILLTVLARYGKDFARGGD